MFTGIVEELGEIVSKDQLADAARFVIRGPLVTTDAGHGDSIAVNGVCLTVVDVLPDGAWVSVDRFGIMTPRAKPFDFDAPLEAPVQATDAMTTAEITVNS